MKTISIAASLLAALFVTPAIAGSGANGRPMKAELLAKYDANNDGKLDRAERKVAKQARRADKLAKYDADGDGTLSDAERETVRTDRVIARFTRIDTNNDGVVTFEEFEAGAKMHDGKRHKRGKGHMRRGKRGKRGKGGNNKASVQ